MSLDLGLAVESAEALIQDEVAVLGLGDFDVFDRVAIEQAKRAAVGIEGFVEEDGVYADC